MIEETTFDKLKKGLLELMRGYPDYRFFGKIEFYLKNGQSSIKVLDNDCIIELAPKKEEEILNKKLTPEQLLLLKAEGKEKPDCWYRLTSKGIDLAISMINLEHSEKTKKLTDWVVFLTTILVIFGFAQLLLIWLQIKILI